MENNPIIITDLKDLVDWTVDVLEKLEARIEELERRADVAEATIQEKIDEITAGVLSTTDKMRDAQKEKR